MNKIKMELTDLNNAKYQSKPRPNSSDQTSYNSELEHDKVSYRHALRHIVKVYNRSLIYCNVHAAGTSVFISKRNSMAKEEYLPRLMGFPDVNYNSYHDPMWLPSLRNIMEQQEELYPQFTGHT